jgi:hypothetical protein
VNTEPMLFHWSIILKSQSLFFVVQGNINESVELFTRRDTKVEPMIIGY